jgi:hypothetical protein
MNFKHQYKLVQCDGCVERQIEEEVYEDEGYGDEGYGDEDNGDDGEW